MPSLDSPPASGHIKTDDPLWLAFERIITFYQMRVNKNLVESQVPIDWAKPLTATDLMMVAKHLGMGFSIRQIAGIDVGQLQKPSLILSRDAKVFVALPQDDMIPSLWVPQGDVDLDAMAASRERSLYALEFDKKAASETLKEQLAESNVEWFWKILRNYKREYLDIGLATFFINFFALITPLFSMTVFDRVVPNHAHETLLAITIGIVLAFLLNMGFKFIRGHILGAIIQGIATRLDIDFMDQLLRLSIPSHQMSVGEKFDLFHELQSLRDFFASRLLPAVVDMPFFLLFLLVVYIISPAVTVVVVIGVILLFAANVVGRLSVRQAAKAYFRDARSKNSVLVEYLEGAQSIRMYNAIGFSLLRWQTIVERVAASARRNQHMSGIADDLSFTVMSLISVFVIVVGVGEIEAGHLTLGGLVACNILVPRTLQPIMSLASFLGRLRQSLDSLKSIDRIFHLAAEPRIGADYALKGPFSGAMRMQDVTFYHPGQIQPTLYHFNLDIKPGDRVGIIGRTGAGKSTVTKLLEGNLSPQTGHVFADNIILDSIHPAEWRQGLGIVPQEPFIFSGTLRENILLGVKDEVDEGWFKQVLAMSGLDMLMQQAGYGIDFQAGEGGVRLSGGQRQAVALCRALIRKPQILLLDEPTNGMDNDLEQRVKTSLQAYLTNRTLVMVTHRTPLLSLVKRLVLIDRGTVAADGPTEEIVQKLSGKA